MTKESDIRTAYCDNLRNNQIGGKTDGISEDDASDLGFSTYRQTIDLLKSLEPQVAKVASAAGQIICGDCGEVIPCQHASGSSTIG